MVLRKRLVDRRDARRPTRPDVGSEAGWRCAIWRSSKRAELLARRLCALPLRTKLTMEHDEDFAQHAASPPTEVEMGVLNEMLSVASSAAVSSSSTTPSSLRSGMALSSRCAN